MPASLCLPHQPNWNNIQAPEPEHHPGASAELLRLLDAGGADCAAGELSLSLVSPTPHFVPGWLDSPRPHPCVLIHCPLSLRRLSFQNGRDSDVYLLNLLVMLA